MKNNNNLAYFILILTTIFWSGNFIVGKAASIYEIPPFSLNFYRWFFAGLILLPFTYREIFTNKDILKNAPHTAKVVCSSEWVYNYTREQAAYPIDQTNKFWPAVSRIDNVYGDRNLVCSCANYFDET